jgi:hypothetical protein
LYKNTYKSQVTNLFSWKTPRFNRLKVNPDDSVVGSAPWTARGDLFRDFALKLGNVLVLHVEQLAMIHAREIAHMNGWHNPWIESDSTAALRAFSYCNMVPWDLSNCWSNCIHFGLHVVTSHIFIARVTLV